MSQALRVIDIVINKQNNNPSCIYISENNNFFHFNSDEFFHTTSTPVSILSVIIHIINRIKNAGTAINRKLLTIDFIGPLFKLIIC